MRHTRFIFLIALLILASTQGTACHAKPSYDIPDLAIKGDIPTPDGALAILGMGRIIGTAISPDGNYLAVSTSRALMIYDLISLERVILDTANFGQVVWSPDGKWIAVEEYYGKGLIIWDAATKERVGTYPLWDQEWFWPSKIEWSPDGSMLAVISFRSPLRIIDASTGEPVAEFELHEGGDVISWFPDSKSLVVGKDYGSVHIVDLEHNQIRQIAQTDTEQISALAVSPDGNKLAVAFGYTGWELGFPRIKIINIDNLDELEIIDYEHGSPSTVNWSADGTALLTGWEDGTILLNNGETGELQHIIAQHYAGASFSQDVIVNADWTGEDRIVSISNNSEVQIHNSDTFELIASFFISTHTSNVEDITWSSDGAWMATAGRDGQALIWDTNNYQLLVRIHDPDVKATYEVAFSPENDYLAILTSDNRWFRGNDLLFYDSDVWQLTSPPPTFSRKWLYDQGGTHIYKGLEPDWLDVSPGSIVQIQYSPDGRLIAALDTEERVTVWDVDSESILYTFSANPWPTPGILVFSPDSHILITRSVEEKLELWDTSSGEKLGTVPVNGIGLGFSPDGSLLGVGHGDGTITLWAVETLLSDK